jgi:hypothetical protein
MEYPIKHRGKKRANTEEERKDRQKEGRTICLSVRGSSNASW